MSNRQSDAFWDRLDEHIESLSETLGLHPRFLHDLAEEADDWSFIVKLHAVIEAAVNELMATKLDKPVADVIERLNVSFRIDILQASGAISRDDAQRMQTLGKLRNKLAHRVEHTNFELIALVDTDGKRKDFVESYIHPEWRFLLQQTETDHPQFRARYGLWLSVLQVVAITKDEKQKARALAALHKLTSPST